MTRPGVLVRTERIPYREAWDVQRRLAAARAAGEVPDVLWVLEHPPTYTAGRHGTREDLHVPDATLEAAGAEFVRVDRGGQMTWHGPGQSVLYGICDLRPGRRVRAYVEAMVTAMRDAAAIPGAAPGADAMGLYAGGRKLGSVGIRVSEGITSHGLALNRDPDLDWFTLMTACGAPGVAATSIAAEGGDPDRARVDAALADSMAAALDLSLEEIALNDLLDTASARVHAT
ncbi:MAG TPA: lipoyl(octanoyl) transferase LipB [Miltoncostaea sp.]|nr:lipoyl(octanoyl) transferase LipB [Miltoncostaea sp.]